MLFFIERIVFCIGVCFILEASVLVSNYSVALVIYMKENGARISNMGLEQCIGLQEEKCILGNGQTDFKMVWAPTYGPSNPVILHR